MSPEDIAFDWWQDLGAGDRAELRRAKDLASVLITRPANILRGRLADTPWRRAEAIGLIAGVLAHVREDSGVSPARAMRPSVSELRFRRLVAVSSHGLLFRPAVRLVRQLGGQASIRNLARSLYWWNDRTRRQWAYEFYGADQGETE